MRCPRAALLAAFGLLCLYGAAVAQTAPPKTFVEVDGHQLHVRLSGTAKSGVPTVVFESGLGSAPIDTWSSVRSEVAAMARTVGYERAGSGASAPGPEPRSIKQLVAELHTLLTKLEVPPPYVLVGHSYGGAIIHSFAATYPKEIAGLVYVDPTDFMQTEADILALWEKAGARDGRDGLRKMQEQMMASAPAGVKAEFRELDRMERGGFVELRAAGDPPGCSCRVPGRRKATSSTWPNLISWCGRFSACWRPRGHILSSSDSSASMYWHQRSPSPSPVMAPSYLHRRQASRRFSCTRGRQQEILVEARRCAT